MAGSVCMCESVCGLKCGNLNGSSKILRKCFYSSMFKGAICKNWPSVKAQHTTKIAGSI